jgi:hypothetical protein
MLKKKFFIHLFFSKESQYDILAVASNDNQKFPAVPGPKNYIPNQLDLQQYLSTN